MSKALMDMAKDIVENNAKIGTSTYCCIYSKFWCAGAACHGDVIAEKVREIVIVLSEERELKAPVPQALSAHPAVAPRSKL